jgi:hypothetical protein
MREPRIGELSAELLVLNAEIDKLDTLRASKEKERRELYSPYKIGDTISWNRGNSVGIVERVQGDPGYLRWLVLLLKKNGTPGKQATLVYESMNKTELVKSCQP